jgi:hypothetical protein
MPRKRKPVEMLDTPLELATWGSSSIPPPSTPGSQLGPVQCKTLSGPTSGSSSETPTPTTLAAPGKSQAPASTRPSLMSHDQRRKLIEAPFQSRYIPGKTWGGCYVGNSGFVPTEGHKTWTLTPADESYLRYGKSDEEGAE